MIIIYNSGAKCKPATCGARITSAMEGAVTALTAARGAAPYRAGEDTRDVLVKTLGYTPERVNALLRSGAVDSP